MIPSEEKPIDYSWQEKHPLISGVIVVVLGIIAIPYFLAIGLFLLVLWIKECVQNLWK